MDVVAGQLVLRELTADDAERIVRGQRLPGEEWAAEYPSLVQLDYLEAYAIEARSRHPEHHWQSQIRRGSDGLVVGGAGVTGPPDELGAVVIGYELVSTLGDAVRGVDIVRALIDIARRMGAKSVTTNVFDDDQVRRHVYFGAGLTEVQRDGRVVYLERSL